MARTPPWKRKNPKTKPATKMTAEQIAAARAAAQRAGRRYPNLIDNMNAMKKR